MTTLKNVLALLQGDLLTPANSLELEFSDVFASDLMSDVLAFVNPGSLLLTGLVNSHVVRTADLADVAAVVFVQGKRPAAEVLLEAREKNLPIISTACSMFEACARIGSPKSRR